MKNRHMDVTLFMVVDLREILNTYRAMPGMYSVYRDFPLQDIIQCILLERPDCDLDGTDRIWCEFESRLGVKTFDHDLDAIDLMFETMIHDIDEYIRWKAPEHAKDKNFVFEKWTNSVSVLLSTVD